MIARHFDLLDNLAVDDQMHISHRGDFAAEAEAGRDGVRTGSFELDPIAGRVSVDFEIEQRSGRHKTATSRRRLEPGLHTLLAIHLRIRAAIAQPAAGGVVAGTDARELIADVQEAVPILQPQLAINAELQQLHAVDISLNGVGVNLGVRDRFGVAAVTIKGESSLVARFAGDDSVQRSVVGIDLLVRQHQIVAEIQIEMSVGGAAVFLAREEVILAPIAKRLCAQSAKLRRRQRLHDSLVRPGRFVVGQDAGEMNILRLQQIEDRLLVGVILPP